MTTSQHDHPNPISSRTLIAAWAFPVFVLGGFALLSVLPLIGVLIAAARNRSRALRWSAGALTTAYAVPLALWLLGPSDAPSLTKFLSPAATTAIVATGVAVAVALHVLRRRPAEARSFTSTTLRSYP